MSVDWKLCHIPDSCKQTEIVVGIDEAGRGPVLGDLVYAMAFWPASENENISKLAFNDSKQLKEGERESLLRQIINHPHIGWVIEIISPVSISEEMLKASPTSLNALSYDAVIRGLKKIVEDRDTAPTVTDVFVDTVGDPEYYKSRLISGLGADYGNFIIEKKADAKFKVVSAASIIAKVTRDTLLRKWEWNEKGITLDKKFGSGYPGDETCVDWLKKAYHPIFGFPDIVRFSWSTSRDFLIKEGAMEAKWECDDDEDAAGSASITDYFSANKPKRVRTSYFSKRKFTRVTFDTLR
eukprot:gene798-851_t